MITLTAHLENGKKYSFEIPEGYPWVEYNSYGDVWVWEKEPRLCCNRPAYYSESTDNNGSYRCGRIYELTGCEPQVQQIRFHD